MHLLIKLSSLLTIVFYIFIWSGCGSEEAPAPPKTVAKKIIAKPPISPKNNGVQDSGTLPDSSKSVTKKIIAKPPTAPKNNVVQDSGTLPDSSKSVTKKTIAKPLTIPKKNVILNNSTPSASSSKSASKDIPKKVPLSDDNKTVPPIAIDESESSETSEDFSKTEPKDNSVEKIAHEPDTSQLPQEDDNARSDSKPEEALPSSTTQPQDDIKTHASDTEELLVSEKTTSSYNPKGGVDPFVPFIKKTKPKEGPTPKPDRHRGPLEKVDIGQLHLVGIIRAPSGNLALVELADGKGYIIQQGTPIGVNEGRVTEILANEVKVEEEGIDEHNEPITKKRSMQIKRLMGEI